MITVMMMLEVSAVDDMGIIMIISVLMLMIVIMAENHLVLPIHVHHAHRMPSVFEKRLHEERPVMQHRKIRDATKSSDHGAIALAGAEHGCQVCIKTQGLQGYCCLRT